MRKCLNCATKDVKAYGYFCSTECEVEYCDKENMKTASSSSNIEEGIKIAGN
jgi:predicted transport protein